MHKIFVQILQLTFILLGSFSENLFAQILEPGETFSGKKLYTVVKKLGSGGAGHVFLVRGIEDQQLYALKLIRQDHPDSEHIQEIHQKLSGFLLKTLGRSFEGLSFAEMATVAEDIAMETAAIYNIPHATMIETGKGYRLKAYLGNYTGEDLIREIVAGEIELNDEKLQGLKTLVENLGSKNLAPYDFKPSNTMWYNGQWHFIDLLALVKKPTPEEAWEVISLELKTKWKFTVQGSALNIADLI